MTMSSAQQEVLEKILSRAGEDLAFRRALLVDPRTAIREAFGIRIPPDFRVKFIERDANVDALIVLPDAVMPDGELSERDLEAVAGGAEDPSDLW